MLQSIKAMYSNVKCKVKMLQSIKAMYSNVKCKVKIEGEVGNNFSEATGL